MPLIWSVSSTNIFEENQKSDIELVNTPPENRKIAEKSYEERLLPTKTAKAYKTAYAKFLTWHRFNHVIMLKLR